MANIANLITKLSGIIASLDDIRDAISQGGGGSSTASGVSVTPTSPLTGTNLQATTNETAALLQEHTDDISALNSSLSNKVNGIGNASSINLPYTSPSDGFIQVNLTSDAGQSAYYNLDAGGRTLITKANNGSESCTFVVQANQTFTLMYTENVSSVTVYFIPMTKN